MLESCHTNSNFTQDSSNSKKRPFDEDSKSANRSVQEANITSEMDTNSVSELCTINNDQGSSLNNQVTEDNTIDNKNISNPIVTENVKDEAVKALAPKDAEEIAKMKESDSDPKFKEIHF